jgi:hypothetical protein
LKIIVNHSLIYELISKLLKTEVRINQIPRKCSIFSKTFLTIERGDPLPDPPQHPLSRNMQTVMPWKYGVWIYTYLITSKVVNVTPARDAHVSR